MIELADFCRSRNDRLHSKTMQNRPNIRPLVLRVPIVRKEQMIQFLRQRLAMSTSLRMKRYKKASLIHLIQ